MIPDRMRSNQIFAKELKSRVSACRKRLRFNRPTNKVHTSHRVDKQTQQVFPETPLLVSDILDNHVAKRDSLIPLECSAAFANAEASPSTMLQALEEHEVGIT
jgi:hypothetical protein